MRSIIPVLAVLLAGAATAHARLPGLTPEQSQLAETKKAEEAQQAREQQQALERVQDRIAAQFGSGKRNPAAGPTEQGQLPQKAVEASGSTGPQGGRRQSAEAHSTPAK